MLYFATGGAHWGSNNNWLSDAPLGDWFGVDTGEDGRVVSLYLWGNGMRGEIPPELATLERLRWLELGNNGLHGEIPIELATLADLQTLSLGANQLTGEIPPELGRLSKLEELRLSSNELSGKIPAELGKLSSLTTLDLAFNRLTGDIPPELGRLSSLESLRLGNNELTGCIPEGLFDAPTSDLEQLGLKYCNPERAALVALYHDTDGPNWRYDTNWLTEAPLGDWFGVNTDESGRVVELHLTKHRLSGEIPRELGSLSELRWLTLFGNQLNGEIPPELGSLSNLKGLSSNQLSGEIPPELGDLSNLESEQQPVERKDTAGIRQSRQSAIAKSQPERPGRGDSYKARQPLKPG